MSVIPGIERLGGEQARLVRGARLGLLAHPAAVDRRLRHAATVLGGVSGTRVVRLFAPEHGIAGGAQDMEPVRETVDPVTGLPVVSLYGEDESSLAPTPDELAGLDAIVVDLVDVGARYYTFAATAIRLLGPAGRAGVRVIVADRPNPLGGLAVEGGPVTPTCHSFVSELNVPARHGLTIGELCRLAHRRRRIDVELTIVRARGWRRGQWWDETGLPWVLPSPNMPTLDTATVYPGTCLVEGTNLSEGRGTTRPFELVGAPWLRARELAERLDARRLPGVRFRPACFVPTFHKHAGRRCEGVQLHVFDRRRFRPVRTGAVLLAEARAAAPDEFAWRTEPYEFVSDRPAIDLLAGGEDLRRLVDEGRPLGPLFDAWHRFEREFATERRGIQLYRDGP
ncbi:MAG: DUF1343 domain-containing protein [Acidobacteriota bacterium]